MNPRRYGQRNGDGDYPIEENTEEDNWRFVEASQAKTPLKPVIDDEPIYEDIPQGLHWYTCQLVYQIQIGIIGQIKAIINTVTTQCKHHHNIG